MRYTFLGLAAFGALAVGGLMSATAPASAACFGIGPAMVCTPTRGGVAVHRGGAYIDTYQPRRHVKKRHHRRHVYGDRYYGDSYAFGDPYYNGRYDRPGWNGYVGRPRNNIGVDLMFGRP